MKMSVHFAVQFLFKLYTRVVQTIGSGVIWFLGKIYLVPLSFILCNAFWFRWVKRVQRNASTLEQYTLVHL